MLAKGIVYIKGEELKKLIGLDDNSEIVGVNLDGHGIEIKIISSEPVDGITDVSNGELMRRRYLSLPVSTIDDVTENIAKKMVNHLRARGENNDA